MKVHRELGRKRKMRSEEILAQWPEESMDSSVTKVLLKRAGEFGLQPQDLELLRGKMADIHILEQAASPLLSDRKRAEVLEAVAEHPPLLGGKEKTELILGHFKALSYGAWVQLFPEEKDFVRLDEDELQSAVRELQGEQTRIISKERILLNLMQIMPDKQNELRGVIGSDINESWKERDQIFNDWNRLNKFFGRLAAWQLIHPEEKEKYPLTTEEKKKMIDFMAKMAPGRGFESFLRNACIVLAEEAVLQDNGQIRIQMKKRQLGGPQVKLPERPQI